MRYFIELAYKGTAYHGWQNQPNAITVQQVLEQALTTLLKREIGIMGAGRTDTGVHAKQMVAHFDLDEVLDNNLVFKLNQFLPKDIVVYQIHQMTDGAHARFDATSRSYQYFISENKDPFHTDLSYFIKGELDIEAMNKASQLLLNYKNFKCFSKSNSDVKTYNCNLMQADWTRDGGQLIFTVKADRFLRNMVRAIVGTMIAIGSGKLSVEALHDIIASEDRSEAGTSVPAQGLFLTKITYPDTIFVNGEY